MSYTDIGNGGRIYDVGEGGRLQDALSQQEQIFLGIENTIGKDKKTIRYAIVGVGSVLILVLLMVAVRKKK
jgi:predicted ribonuclease toxin of YeeF-YezG toxin-antitoxin module